MTAFLQYFRNPFAERRIEKKPENQEPAPSRDDSQMRQPAATPSASAPQQAPLSPAVMQGKPAPREFEPVKPLEPVPAGTEVIKEPEIK